MRKIISITSPMAILLLLLSGLTYFKHERTLDQVERAAIERFQKEKLKRKFQSFPPIVTYPWINSRKKMDFLLRKE